MNELHPKEWTIAEKLTWLHYEKKVKLEVLSKMTDEQLTDLILKFEIDME